MKKKALGIVFAFLIAIIFITSILSPCFANETALSPEIVPIELTESEKKYVLENPNISIAIDTSWTPYGFTLPNSITCQGIIPNIMNLVAKRVGLNVTFVPKPTYIAAISACNTGETTLVSGIANDANMAERNRVRITKPYITINYSAVTNNDLQNIYSSGVSHKVALDRGTYAKDAMQKMMPSYEFVEYNYNYECMDAILNSEADIALIATYSAEYFHSMHEYSNLHTVQINDCSWGLSFGVNQDEDSILIDILNKGIDSISENEVNRAIYSGMVAAANYNNTLSDLIYRHPLQTSLIASLLMTLIAFLVFLFILQHRKIAELFREQKLKSYISEKNLLLNSIPGGIATFEIIDGIPYERYINDSFYALVKDTRVNRNLWTYNNFENGVYEEDRPKIKDCIKKIIAGADSDEITYRALCPDGTNTWMHLAARVSERSEKSIVVNCTITGIDGEVALRQALQESADIVDAAMKSANMTVWNYDCINHRIVQNLASRKQHGFEHIIENAPESLIESGYVHPNSVSEYRSIFEKINTATTELAADFLVRTPDKEGYWWERLIVTPIIENGKVTKAIGTSFNVTERKEKENQYIRFIDTMSSLNNEDLIAKGRHDLIKNQILYYERSDEPGVEAKEGDSYDASLELLVKTAVDANQGELLNKMLNRKNLIADFSEGKTEGSFEYNRRVKNDATIWALIKYSLAEEPNTGNIILFIYAYDISERILENNILQRFSDLEYDALFLLDVETHRYSLKNVVSDIEGPSFETEGDYDSAIFPRIEAVVLPEEKETLKKQFTISTIIAELSKHDSYYITYSVIDDDGSVRRKRYRFCYLDETKKTLMYYRTDITEMYEREQKQLLKTEEALKNAKNASDAKTEFFSRMSHDMRTPMNGILGMADLSEDENDLQVLKQNIKKIKFSGEYLLGLINDTLDFQKIESGKLLLEPQVVYVNDLLQSVSQMIQSSADEKGVNFKVVTDGVDLGSYITTDALRIKQIFINLLSNAVKFTPKDGTVEFKLEVTERNGMTSFSRLSVLDTGIGMSNEFLEKSIFKPFSQEYNEVTKHYAGTGLGLSIAKKLVELMGGTISVKSELGVGTSFVIEMAFHRVPPSANNSSVNDIARQKTALESLKGKKLLLAEDNQLNAEIAERLLSKANCNVSWAKNGEECLELFNSSQENHFDAILMDVRMPVMDGIDATKAIRSLTREDAKRVPIIAMTANAYADDVKKCLEAGMNAHISKPIEPLVMYETIANAINP